jgi:hypothetical protein
MKNSWWRRLSAISALIAVGIALGCTEPAVDGKYQDSDGAVTLQLNGGQAHLEFGMIHVDGKYGVEKGQVVIRPTSGPNSNAVAFTINKDGSLDPPPGTEFPKLMKAK